jgi:hypothetical protein
MKPPKKCLEILDKMAVFFGKKFGGGARLAASRRGRPESRARAFHV